MNLKEHLDRLNIHDDGSKFGDREKLLDGFVKQGYLHRAKVGDEARGNNDNVWEYYWGPRARAEILDSNIVDFIISVSNDTLYSLISYSHVCHLVFRGRKCGCRGPFSQYFQSFRVIYMKLLQRVK